MAWEEFFKIAVGVWNMSRKDFYEMTVEEFSHIFNMKHGKATRTHNGLSYDEYKDLEEFTDEVKAGKYG